MLRNARIALRSICCFRVCLRIEKSTYKKERGKVCGRKTECKAGEGEVFFRSDFNQYDCCAAHLSGIIYFISSADAFGGQLFGGGSG